MAEQVFKAPGYYDREIDLSVRLVQPEGVPYGVIGASQKGPAFVPITVGSFTDFEPRFGTLDTRFAGPYVVDEVLKSRSALTFVRILGAGSNATIADIEATRVKGTVRNAGMQVTGSAVGAGDTRHKGAVQFLAAKHKVTSSEAYGYPMFSDNNSYDLVGSNAYLVRAMIMTAYDTRIMVLSSTETFSNFADDAATIDDTSTNPTYRKFKLVISSSAGTSFSATDGLAGLRILTASLDPSSADYVGKILNTDPERFATEKHVMYADYAVDAEIATVASGTGNDDSVVILSGSANTSATSGDTSLVFRDAFGRFDTRFKTPRTPSFISQPFGATEYDLFYVEGIDDGDYANSEYKISIVNVRASTDPRNEYGSFTLLVRAFDDTDYEPKVLEQFNNVTLNPDSDAYIAKIIGSKKVFYNFDVENEDDRRLITVGNYGTRSKYVRVIVADAVERKAVPAECLPFGFRGPQVLNTNTRLVDSGSVASVARMGGSGSFSSRLSGSIVPPLPFRFKVTRGELTSSAVYTGQPGASEIVDTRLYWGVKFERNTNVVNTNVSNEPNAIIKAFTKFTGIDKLDVLVTGSRTDDLNNNKFTLARVALSALSLATVTASAETHMKEAAYIRHGAPNVSDYTITDGAWGNRVTLATLISKGSPTDFNRFSDYTKFTTILCGGWNGSNIFDKDASRFNDRSTSQESSSIGYGGAAGNFSSPGATPGVNYSGNGQQNNAVNSYRVAVNIMTDPNVFNGNILVIPGIRDTIVTDYALQQVRDVHNMSMYLVDVPYYDFNNVRIFDGETGRYIDTNKTSDALESRAIDNNAGAGYFPNIVIDDKVNNRRVTVPASVAAASAFSFNDFVSYPWFAPAGFNRAALEFVKLTQTRIKEPERQRLYEVNLNPISKFPGDGYVIFSQNTLQQSKDALSSINIKRMILEVKRSIVEAGTKILWEQITPDLYPRFAGIANSLLSTVQLRQGLERFKIICDDTNNTDIDREANRMNGRIEIVPTRSVEFIGIDFVVLPSGVQFSSL